MDRNKVLTELHSYIQSVEKDTTMILQSIPWDRKHLLESPHLVKCRYDRHHRMPHSALAEHEAWCVLRSDGYSLQDDLLPDPPYCARHSLVKLGDAEIQEIINDAAKSDPLFIRAIPTNTAENPYNLLDLTAVTPDSTKDRTKTRAEMLALERDMRRRRVKYRGAVKSTNYSHTLREIIATQMEMYRDINIKVENDDNDDTQSISTKESIPSQRLHKSHSHRTHHNDYSMHEHPNYKGRNNDIDDREISTHRQTRYMDKNNSRTTDDEYSSRRRDSIDIYSSDSRYGHDRERNKRSESHKYKVKRHRSERSESHTERERNKRSESQKYKVNRHRSERSESHTERERNKRSGSQKYKVNRHRSGRSDCHTERKKDDRKSYDSDNVKVKEEPNDDYSYEPKRKRSEHHLLKK